jgi:hypothetical protein
MSCARHSDLVHWPPRSGHRSGAAPEATARPELARGRLGADVVTWLGRVRPRGGISRRRATSTITCPAHRTDHIIALGERHPNRPTPWSRGRCTQVETMRANRPEPLLADRDDGGVPQRSSARSRPLDPRWWHGGLGPPEGVASCRVTPGVSSVRVCKTVGVSRQPSLEEHLGRCFSQRESARVIRIRRRERRM